MPTMLDRQHATEPGTVTVPAPPAAAEPVAAADDRPRMTRRQLAALVATPVALVLAGWGGAYLIYQRVRPAEPTAALDHRPPDGAKLFAQHCAACHGVRGDGAGATSPHLDPPARRFGEERFRLATTANGAPTDDDLLAVVRDGIPGSAMPAFAQLAEEERRALVGHVRGLAREALFARIFRKAEQEGSADPADVAEAVENLLRPGPTVEVPAQLAAATPQSVAHGRQLYAQNCASCHGPEGRGDGPQVKDLKNENGWPTRPRDLTRGVFKGGGDPGRLYARILVGMPGTPMPASTTLKPEDVGDLVNFVLSLSGSGSTAPAGVDRASNP
jgi:mono/diheme cytochrome c family protein